MQNKGKPDYWTMLLGLGTIISYTVITHFSLNRAVWCLYGNTSHWCAIQLIFLIPVLFNLSYIATWMTLKLIANKWGCLLDYHYRSNKITNEIFNTSYYLFLKCYSEMLVRQMTCNLVFCSIESIIYTKFIIFKFHSQYVTTPSWQIP